MRIVWQIALIMAFYGSGAFIARITHAPLPASVIGLGLILLALHRRWIKPAHLRDGAQALLGRMLLFFVPAVPVLIEHREFVSMLGVRLMLAVAIGTVLVMAVTGAVVQMVAGADD
ncbi:CidA/LrgA family protein [Novosphingobium humi]|nr:CidA/LrgA family protein [Novosphingobium humi]WJS97963.1 CidA/LrgA family protein [Novosphingobium humi]